MVILRNKIQENYPNGGWFEANIGDKDVFKYIEGLTETFNEDHGGIYPMELRIYKDNFEGKYVSYKQ